MRLKRRVLTMVAAAAVTAMVATGCSAAEERSASDPVVVSITSTFPDLDPHHTTSNVNYLVNFDNLYEGLVYLDGTSSEPRPGLATSWEQTDETTLTMHLREGVQFHDGTEFNAEAAAFSIKRVTDDPESADLASYYGTIEDARAVDEYTLEVETSEFNPDLALSLSMIMMVSPETAVDHGSLSRVSAGTGPYELASKDADTLVMTPFEDYWGEPAPDRDIEVISRPEVATSVAGIQTGEVDIAFDIPAEQIELMPEIKTAPVLETVVLRVNGLTGMGADPRAREAITLAINDDDLRTYFLGDEFSEDPKCQLVAEGLVGYSDTLETPEPDLEAARRIVQEEGLGKESIRLVGVQGRYPKGGEVLEAIGSSLTEAGFNVQVEIRDTQSWLNELYVGPDAAPDLVLVGVGTDQWTLTQPYKSIVAASSSLSLFPHEEFPGVQEAMDAARTETDPEAREKLLGEASAGICESDAFIWLYNYNQVWGAQEGIDWAVRDDNRIEFTTVTVDEAEEQ